MKTYHEYIIKYNITGTKVKHCLVCVAYTLPEAIQSTRQQMINMGYSEDAFRMIGYTRK